MKARLGRTLHPPRPCPWRGQPALAPVALLTDSALLETIAIHIISSTDPPFIIRSLLNLQLIFRQSLIACIGRFLFLSIHSFLSLLRKHWE